MESEDITKKTKQFIDKNNDLLNEKKYYQFAQKIKLVGNRKLQTKKSHQAQALFKSGADTLYSIQQVEKHAPLQLLIQLVNLYEKQPILLTQASQNDFIRIITKKSIETTQIKLILSLLQKTGKPKQHLILANFYIDYHVKNKKFANVERIASSISLDKAWELYQKWQQNVHKQQVPAIWSRMVLWIGVFNSIDDANQSFQRVRQLYTQQNPYFVFTGFLLKTVLLNSKQAYQTMQRSYNVFLEADPIFSGLFMAYGQKYFKIQRKKGGIFNLLQ